MNPYIPYNDLPLLPPQVEVETKEVLRKAITANHELADLKGSVPERSTRIDEGKEHFPDDQIIRG